MTKIIPVSLVIHLTEANLLHTTDILYKVACSSEQYSPSQTYKDY